MEDLSTVLLVVIAVLFIAPPIYVGLRALARLAGRSKDDMPPGPDGL